MEAMIDLAEAETKKPIRPIPTAASPRAFAWCIRYEVDYNSSGNFNTDINRLTAVGDGYLDDVHPIRDQYGADLVSLLIDDNDYCGITWLMTNLSTSFATHVFGVVYHDCATAQGDVEAAGDRGMGVGPAGHGEDFTIEKLVTDAHRLLGGQIPFSADQSCCGLGSRVGESTVWQHFPARRPGTRQGARLILVLFRPFVTRDNLDLSPATAADPGPRRDGQRALPRRRETKTRARGKSPQREPET